MHPTSRTRLLFTLLALALAACFGPTPASAAEKGVETDLAAGTSWKQQDRTVAGVQDLGAKWVRLKMSWADVEPTKGSYSSLSQYDTAITKAANTGAKIVVTVYESPGWASGSQDYANFARFAATRWGSKVDAWEIWNEPNTTLDPAAYAELLKAAYPAVKGADPTALVVYGGVARNDYGFVEQSYAAEPNLGNYYDVMATHPYPTPANTSPASTWLESDGRLAAGSFAGYREIRRAMLANGDDKPIWLTEFGWATTTLAGVGVSEATQAAYLTLAMQCVEQDPYVQVAIWYVYRNHASAHDADTWFDQLGLVRTNFSRKPAYDAFKAYTPGNTGCTYEYPAPAAAPAPIPEPAPAPEPAPTAEPASESDPADEPQSEVEGVESSSVRREVELRLVRLARASGSGSTRRVRMRVTGKVSNTHRGRVDLNLRCRARGDGDWRRSMTRRLDVSRAGEYETRIRPRRRAACRIRASYYAFGQRLARSPIVRFKT